MSRVCTSARPLGTVKGLALGQVGVVGLTQDACAIAANCIEKSQHE